MENAIRMTQSNVKVNLACGGVFVAGDGWINLDYGASTESVQRADLLARLPLPDEHAALVYSSHFLEHIPRDQVAGFLTECWRILAPNGLLRLVLPDLENLCRAYLTHRERGEHDLADFVVLEMIDQCVRRESGGELGRYYRMLKSSPDEYAVLIEFGRERTGENILSNPSRGSLKARRATIAFLARGIQRRLERILTRAVLQLLPKAFRAQNVSLATVGERHHWLWDFEQLRGELERAGFEAVTRCTASESRFDGFPFQSLDLDAEGRPRKGAESMYIEAIKP
jgi:SAM-dependent methyltransferase